MADYKTDDIYHFPYFGESRYEEINEEINKLHSEYSKLRLKYLKKGCFLEELKAIFYKSIDLKEKILNNSPEDSNENAERSDLLKTLSEIERDISKMEVDSL